MPEGRGARPAAALAYGGYHQTWPGRSDEELTRVGPGTACGEYLRRFWQPVAMSEELKELPLLRRILGEDLVLFRDKGGRLGLVHRRCPHRRASLEFGVCEERGIRCCYHGWRFDVDGRILEVPGQPDGVEAKLQQTVALGAYPTLERKGLIFAYLGPPEEKPAFPVYDTLEIPDQIMTPYQAPFACNWLQVLDAILDPIHTSFLHSRISRQQFSEGLGALGAIKFYDRPSGYLGTFTRRVGDYAWVRTNELVLPNFTQAGAALAADGTRSRYFGRTDFARWVVPVDDEATVCYAWAMFGERADPPEYNTWEGAQLIEQGELFDRSYEERQRFPGDLEATEGMGRISEHEKENLVPSDRGIVLYRKRLRRLCRALRTGERPVQPTELWANPIPTYGGDTVLRLPPDEADGDDDMAYLERIGQAVMEIQFRAEGLTGSARDEAVIARLKRLEAEGIER